MDKYMYGVINGLKAGIAPYGALTFHYKGAFAFIENDIFDRESEYIAECVIAILENEGVEVDERTKEILPGVVDILLKRDGV